MWVNVISSVLEMFILKHWRKKRKETEAPLKRINEMLFDDIKDFCR